MKKIKTAGAAVSGQLGNIPPFPGIFDQREKGIPGLLP
jgi:hypothetical protein